MVQGGGLGIGAPPGSAHVCLSRSGEVYTQLQGRHPRRDIPSAQTPTWAEIPSPRRPLPVAGHAPPHKKMAVRGSRIDFMFLAPPTRPLDPLLNAVNGTHSTGMHSCLSDNSIEISSHNQHETQK